MHIRIIVTRDGEVQFDFDGYQGSTCLSEFERIARALMKQGIEVEVVSQVLKPEAVSSRDSVRL